MAYTTFSETGGRLLSAAAYDKRCKVPEHVMVGINKTGTARTGINYFRLLLIALLFNYGSPLYAQNNQADGLTLDQCVDYAMTHEPNINAASINIAVAKTTNAINLAGWFPQVNASGTVSHYFDLPTQFVPSSAPGGGLVPVQEGIVNSAVPTISATQTIFNPQLLYAAQAAPLYVKQAKQATDSTRINVIVNVSKAFYNLLSTLEQINVLKEDTVQLARDVKDTYHQYIGGIVDETDYLQAVISLNNAKAQLRQQIENVRPGYAQLKQLMGYPPEKQFNVVYDTLKMMDDISFDTSQPLVYEKRIDYQTLETTKKLQQSITNYYSLAFLPTVSAFYNYYVPFDNNNFSDLFGRSYPYSNIGLSFSVPIFTGFARINNIHKSRLQEQMIDWYEVELKSQIYTQYATALANYKYNRYDWELMKDNTEKAKNVYRIVSLQYKYGIVPYLNVFVAEYNLITAEINYTNALFQVLSSKMDLEKALGQVPYKSLTQ